jgi:hypothetical protein
MATNDLSGRYASLVYSEWLNRERDRCMDEEITLPAGAMAVGNGKALRERLGGA